jgi:oligopeptide/dipeptide ABC transporter ATP-binding protein
MFSGRDLLKLHEEELRGIRGKDVSMIFQDPLTSLNPVYRVGHQIAEVLQTHAKLGRIPARERAVELLDEVGIPFPRQRAEDYPHQFSGGMQQRAIIAMAIAMNPEVLLADEPTTALDVTVQAQIMDLLMKLQQDRGTAIVLITHDLALVASYAQRVLVMYAGRVAEVGDADTVFYEPRHGYTYGLLASLPRLERRRAERLEPIRGQPPSLIHVPAGCPFHPRCEFAVDRCRTQRPILEPQVRRGHLVACWEAERVAAAAARHRNDAA